MALGKLLNSQESGALGRPRSIWSTLHLDPILLALLLLLLEKFVSEQVEMASN